MKPLPRIAAVALALTFALPTMAYGDYYDYDDSEGYGRYQHARVLSVTPVTRLIEVSEPRRECWNQLVTHRDESNNRLGLVLGGVVGGILGNQIGDGNGQKIATVAGTILGAGVGREIADRGDRAYTTTERRCRTVHQRYTETRTVGYRVRYRYHGEEYITRMDHHPGERLRVRVDVMPAE